MFLCIYVLLWWENWFLMVLKYILPSVAYGLMLVSRHLIDSDVSWSGCFCVEPASCALGLLKVSWEAFCPGCSKPPKRPSRCGVFKGADRLLISCLGCSRYLERPSLQSSEDHSSCCLCVDILLEAFKLCCLQRTRQAGNLPWKKAQAGKGEKFGGWRI